MRFWNLKAGIFVRSYQHIIAMGAPGPKADAHGEKNLLAAVVSSASDVARPPLAVASIALLLMLFRGGLDVTMMIRSCLPPCEGRG
jgi:hypothetical protein